MALHDRSEAEEALAQQRRLEFQDDLRRKREAGEAAQALKEAKARLAKVRKAAREAQKVGDLRSTAKSFTPPPNVGRGQEHMEAVCNFRRHAKRS